MGVSYFQTTTGVLDQETEMFQEQVFLDHVKGSLLALN